MQNFMLTHMNRTLRLFSTPSVTRKLTSLSAVVIGSGLSSLAAAIRLRRIGINVKVLERQSYPGGLCHSVYQGQSTAEVGCTCFGKGIESMMEEIGVEQKFKAVSHQMIWPNATIQIPFNAHSLWNLSYPMDILRLGYWLKNSPDDETLNHITQHLHNPMFRQMIHAMIAYPLFRSPDDISLQLARTSLKNDYGYEQPRVPIGGMNALINNMIDQYQKLGGDIDYNAIYDGFSYDDTGRKNVKIIDTKTGKTRFELADFVFSSVHGWAEYPDSAESSLQVSSLILTVKRKDVKYPKDTHTLMFFPKDSMGWMKKHEQGELAQEFGFHCFSNDVMHEASEDTYNISVYFSAPRGKTVFSPKEQQGVTNYMISTMEKKLPGLKGAICDAQFYSPDDYKKTLHLDSSVSKRIPPKDFYLSNYNEKDDIYYIGNAVNKDGEQHALGGIMSAKRSVETLCHRENLLIPNDENTTIDAPHATSYCHR
jgi:phytoene dehydrogenase-like protein